MATKRQPAAKGVTLLGFGEIKMTGDGLTIQGFANKAVVDRGNEIIATDAWELENYKKNPVILYNHGFDPQLGSTPVGVATEVTPTEEGLFIKCRLSATDDPLLNRIRGLVQEKILRAFSVGFNPVNMTDDPKTGVKTITKAELFEVSIVGVPMNQDSLFEVTGKMLKSMSADALRADILKRKGAWVAAAVQNTMYEKQKTEKLKRDDMLAAIMDKAEVDEGALTDILAGNVTPVPENVLAAFSEVLGISMDDLKKLDAGDVEVEKNAEGDNADQGQSEGDKPAEGSQGGEGQTPPPAGEGSSGSSGSAGKSDSGAGQTDFQKAVGGKIRELIASGKEKDLAVAEAITTCTEADGAKAQKPTKKDYALWFKLADSLVKQADQGHDAGPTVEGSSDKTEAAQNDFGSPMLEAAKQTNVLLGALISEIQKLSVKLDGLQPQPSKDGTAAADGGAGKTDAAPPPPPPPPPAAEGDAPPPADKPAEGDGTPKDGMSEDELKAAREVRSKKYGVEVLGDGELAFPKDGPTDVEKYGDPVNLKFPIVDAEGSTKSRDEFKKAAGDYTKDESKTVVHGRIVAAQLALGADASYDEKDPLDALLPQALKDKLVESNAKALDSYRKRLEDVKKRLVAVGA